MIFDSKIAIKDEAGTKIRAKFKIHKKTLDVPRILNCWQDKNY